MKMFGFAVDRFICQSTRYSVFFFKLTCFYDLLSMKRLENDNKLYVKYEVIGEQHVSVPTHFFKVVLCENKNGTYDLFSYVLPNAFCNKDIPLQSYLVPIDSIERAAGFLLFDRLMKSKIKLINGK